MENTLTVAKTLFNMYKNQFHKDMDEMKMHKLMYFSQRESLIQVDEILFEEKFIGWKYGPVLHSVREEFAKATPFGSIDGRVSANTTRILSDVLARYGSISSWNLSIMSHEELSWKLSRKGLEPSENGSRALDIEAIKLDAVRERIARKRFTSKSQ